MNRLLISLSAVTLTALPILPAVAAGPYDGTYQVVAGPAGNPGTNTTGNAQCEGIQLQFQVVDNQLVGSLARSPYGGNRVSSSGMGATPISGTVQPDGSFTSKWESYTATGKLTHDGKAEMRWSGQCGPRVASGGRAPTENVGSSTPPK
jgi:hypothetical protein